MAFTLSRKASLSRLQMQKKESSTLTTPGELAKKNLSCFNPYVALEINQLAAKNSVNNYITCSIPSQFPGIYLANLLCICRHRDMLLYSKRGFFSLSLFFFPPDTVLIPDCKLWNQLICKQVVLHIFMSITVL